MCFRWGNALSVPSFSSSIFQRWVKTTLTLLANSSIERFVHRRESRERYPSSECSSPVTTRFRGFVAVREEAEYWSFSASPLNLSHGFHDYTNGFPSFSETSHLASHRWGYDMPTCFMRDLTREGKRFMPTGVSRICSKHTQTLRQTQKCGQGKGVRILPVGKISREAMRA